MTTLKPTLCPTFQAAESRNVRATTILERSDTRAKVIDL
jgi:hypothetical protein